jgi:hypothetical protein
MMKPPADRPDVETPAVAKLQQTAVISFVEQALTIRDLD